jgi:hypothetical protein
VTGWLAGGGGVGGEEGNGCCETGTSIHSWAEVACCGGSISTGGLGCGDGLGTKSNLFTREQTEGVGLGCEL